MQFKSPIYVGDIEYRLMDIDGVRSVNHITITQDIDYRDASGGTAFTTPLYNTVYHNGAFKTATDMGDGAGTIGYGYKYNFAEVWATGGNQNILSPSQTPAVFEIKNPNTDIKGIVR